MNWRECWYFIKYLNNIHKNMHNRILHLQFLVLIISYSRGLIQVGVNVTVPGKKNPLRQSTGLAAGARPVYKMYARPSCVSLWSFNFLSLLTTNSITSKTRKLATQVWAIALFAVSPPNFPWISCSFHLHSIQLRSPRP